MSKLLADINRNPMAGERDNGTIQLQIDQTAKQVIYARIYWLEPLHHRNSVAQMKAKLMAAVEKSGWLEGTVWCATQVHIKAPVEGDKVWFHMNIEIKNSEAKDS